MIPSKTAQVAIYCGLFILVLLFFSFDLALTVTVSAYLLFTSERYIPILGIALAILLLEILFQYFDISFRFISDLSLDAYILFLTAVFLYLKTRKRVINLYKKIRKSGKNIFTKNILSAIGISLILSLLFLPIVGVYFAVILGYLLFSYLTQKFAGKFAYSIALFFLIFCPFFIIAKKDNLAESFAIVSFYFLIMGTIQEIINLVKLKKIDSLKIPIIDEIKQMQERKEERQVPSLLIDERLVEVKKNGMKLPQITFPKINSRLLSGLFSFAISFVLFYFLIPPLSKFHFAFSFPKVSLPKISLFKQPLPLSPSTAPSPTVTIAPAPITKVTSESAGLKIFVQNGTDTQGLAASTAAKLKKAGFLNVDVSNADKQDYISWELITEKKGQDFILLFKSILELTELKSSEATIPAGFEVLIIAGEKK